MMKSPNIHSELISECLFGETIEVIRKEKDWYLSKLTTDEYIGWINSNCLTSVIKNTHIVIEPRTVVTSLAKVKSNFNLFLPLCSQLKVIKEQGLFSQIKFNNQLAFVPSSHIKNICDPIKDWVSISEKLVNTPYKWGGRNSLGIDCSALVQLSLLTKKINIPRDTNDQIKFLSSKYKNTSTISRGSLVYWKGHVAIGINKKQIIHSSGHHLKVIIEDFKTAAKRMQNKGYFVEKIINIIQ